MLCIIYLNHKRIIMLMFVTYRENSNLFFSFNYYISKYYEAY